jgi:hypothetical protein
MDSHPEEDRCERAWRAATTCRTEHRTRFDGWSYFVEKYHNYFPVNREDALKRTIQMLTPSLSLIAAMLIYMILFFRVDKSESSKRVARSRIKKVKGSRPSQRDKEGTG